VRRSGLAPRLLFPVTIVAVWLAFFSKALFAGQDFFNRDLFFFHEPLRRYWTSLVAAGHAPFLNTALNLGAPILANPNNAVFYPGNLLYFVVPFETAWNLSLAGHVLWASLGVYALSRRLDTSRWAALCGALVFGFCGPLVSSLNYYNLLVATSWMPWTAACALMAWRRGGRWSAVTALALAMQIFAGEPTVVIITVAILAGGWAVGLLRDRSRARVVLARGVLIAVVAALVASIQIVPTLEWISHSGRGAGLPFRESAAYWSLHPARLAELIVPHVYGNPMARLAADFWGGSLSDAGLPYVMKLYAGWIPLLLLPLAWRRPFGRWAAVVFVVSLALSLGHHLPGYHTLYDLFAPLRLVRYPEKFTLPGALALAIATTAALDSLDQRMGRAALAAAAVLLLLALPLLVELAPHAGLSPGQRAEQLRAIGQAAAIGGVCWLLLALGTFVRYRRLAAFAIPIVLVLDLVAVTWDIARTRPREEADAAPALLASLKNVPGATLVHLGEQQADAYFTARRDPFQSMQDALHPFTGLRWGAVYGAVDDIDRMGWKVAADRQERLHRMLLSGSGEALPILRECGIDRVVSLAPLSIDGLREASRIPLPEGPTLRVYAVDSGVAPLARFENGDGTLSWSEESPDHITLAVNASSAGTIVVARNALPGWSAVSEGRPMAVSGGPQGLIQLSVPEGPRRIVLAYRPPGLTAGALLSALGLSLLVGVGSVRPSPPAPRSGSGGTGSSDRTSP
jgi:hypothetical protein